MRIQKPKSRKQVISLEKWAWDLNRKFTIDNDYGKPQRCSSSLAVRQMQIETTLTLHFTPVTLARINKIPHNKCGEVVKKATPICCWQDCKLVQALWKSAQRLLKKLKVSLLNYPARSVLDICPKDYTPYSTVTW